MQYHQYSSKSRTTDQLSAIGDTLHNYFFNYPDRQHVQIHLSFRNIKTLFYIRLGCFIYLTAIYIWAIAQMPSFLSDWIYLTMIGYFSTWLYFTVVLLDYWLNQKNGKQNAICKALKYYLEVIFQFAFCVEFPITLVFWGFLFKILIDANVSGSVIAMNANLHAGPLICCLLDFCYNLYSFPWRHLIILVVVGTVYNFINLIYSVSVKPIYQPINWVSLLSYMLVLGSYVLVALSFLLGRIAFQKWKRPSMAGRIEVGLI